MALRSTLTGRSQDTPAQHPHPSLAAHFDDGNTVGKSEHAARPCEAVKTGLYAAGVTEVCAKSPFKAAITPSHARC
jgi:hypothetical protein